VSLLSQWALGARNAVVKRLPTSLQPRAPLRFTAGIEGLPAGVGHMPSGSLNVLAASQLGWANALAASAVVDNQAIGRIFLIADTVDTALAITAHPDVDDALDTGRLIVWVMSSRIDQVLHQSGLRVLLTDLVQAGLESSDLVVFTGPAPLLTWKRMRQMRHQLDNLRRWSSHRRGATCLLILPGTRQAHALEQVRDNRQLFDGIARITQEENKPALLVDQWDSHDGPVLGRRFGLRYDAMLHRFKSDGVVVEHASDRLLQSPDQQSVIVTRAVLANEKGVPPSWRTVYGGHAVGGAARDMNAGVILLDMGGRREFPALAHVVHGIRLEHTRAMKIILRETTEKTRYHHELALLALGATAISTRETPFSRLVQMVDDYATQTHVRDIESDLDAVLAAAESPPFAGYLPVAAFANAVRASLAGTAIIALTHCLVRLPLLPRTSHLQALKSCRITRRGDFFTVEPAGIAMFLYACREPDLEGTLARLLALPITELFSSVVIDTSPEGIRHIADQMADAASGGRLPDYTLYVGSSAPDTLQAPPGAEPAVNVLNGTALLAAAQADAPPTGDVLLPTAVPRRVIHRSPLGQKTATPARVTPSPLNGAAA
jgi:cellulose biosynthesis protein BcsE